MRYDDDTERFMWNGFGRTRRRTGTRRPRFNATCKRCGMSGLKWRLEGDNWRLFEDERIDHNRLKPHVCKLMEDEIEDLGGEA